eukprot:3946550-Amphidinium_carterae.1
MSSENFGGNLRVVLQVTCSNNPQEPLQQSFSTDRGSITEMARLRARNEELEEELRQIINKAQRLEVTARRQQCDQRLERRFIQRLKTTIG